MISLRQFGKERWLADNFPPFYLHGEVVSSGMSHFHSLIHCFSRVPSVEVDATQWWRPWWACARPSGCPYSWRLMQASTFPGADGPVGKTERKGSLSLTDHSSWFHCLLGWGALRPPGCKGFFLFLFFIPVVIPGTQENWITWRVCRCDWDLLLIELMILGAFVQKH